jgi:hypothetical protein
MSGVDGGLSAFIGPHPHSATPETRSIDRAKCILQPSGGKVIENNLFNRLEDLEVVAPLGLGPERDESFERWTARMRTGNLSNEDRGIFRKLKSFAGPFSQASKGLMVRRGAAEPCKSYRSDVHADPLITGAGART